MDKSGIPLAFFINPRNQNEQLSLKPLEQQIMRDFELSKFLYVLMPDYHQMQTAGLITLVKEAL